MPELHLSLAAENRVVAAELKAGLVDLIDLALIAKQADCDLVGPCFRSLHSELDELVDEEVPRILTNTRRDLTELPGRRREQLESLAHALREHETLDGPAAHRDRRKRAPVRIETPARGPATPTAVATTRPRGVSNER